MNGSLEVFLLLGVGSFLELQYIEFRCKPTKHATIGPRQHFVDEHTQQLRYARECEAEEIWELNLQMENR